MEIQGRWLVAGLPASGAGGAGIIYARRDDIDDVMEHLQSLGIDTSQKTSNPQVKTLMIVDPDGNHIAFAQTLDDRMAR